MPRGTLRGTVIGSTSALALLACGRLIGIGEHVLVEDAGLVLDAAGADDVPRPQDDGASDAQGLTEFEFYGKPWENQAMYDSLSPIRKVTRVKTPTLMVQSEDDFRTPMGNAELWYMALKKQGVPVELVRYPRSTHELSRSGEPWLLVDRLGRLRQWFAYWLKGEKPAAVAAP